MKNLLTKSNIQVLNKETSIREFLINVDKNVDEVIDHMANNGYLAGIKYSDNQLLIAVTEKRTRQELDQLIAFLKNQ